MSDEEMKLSRLVRVTLTARWCKREFLSMSPAFRKARGGSADPMNKCRWCKHAFADGEMMALACFKEHGNRTLCQGCADKLLDGAKGGDG